MKKFMAGVATASVLSLGALTFAGGAEAVDPYGPALPTAHQVTKSVKQAIKKPGKISKHKAKKLKKKVKAAMKAGILSKHKAKKLLKKIKKDTRKK